MADIKWGVALAFAGFEQFTDKLSEAGRGFTALGDTVREMGSRIAEAGDRITEWGERLSLNTALMSEGADHMSEWSEAVTEPAMAMEKAMSTLWATTDIHDAALDSLKEHAIEFSNTHPGATAEQWVADFTQMKGLYQDAAKAMDAADVVGKLKRFNVEGEAANKLFMVSAQNLNATAKQNGDTFFAMTKAFGVPCEHDS